jgi:hypothetical protein
MAQILFNAQQQTLPGHFFHVANDIEIPRFNFIHLRERLGPGNPRSEMTETTKSLMLSVVSGNPRCSLSSTQLNPLCYQLFREIRGAP